jgi:hypothetical protein
VFASDKRTSLLLRRITTNLKNQERHDTQHNDTQHKGIIGDIQHKEIICDIQHNDARHNDALPIH